MQAGDVIGERYEVVRQITRTDAGAVFQGRDRVLGNAVAIKLVNEAPFEFLSRLRLEAAILSSLDHPRIARFLEFGESGSGHYLVEAWIDGLTLRRRLDTTGLTPREAVRMGRQLATALSAAHAAGVVHRDIKPSNLLGSGDDWVVIDFGMARVVGASMQLTRTGVVVGTVGYMSPEQASSARDLDARADVFAFGCVLYEALAGAPAFDGESQLAIQAKLLVSDPTPIDLFVPGLPEPLVALISRCLSKVPDERPDDGTALVAALAQIEDEMLPVFSPRPVKRREIATVPSPAPPTLSVILSAPRPELTALTLLAWREHVVRALEPMGGNPVVLPSGALVYVAHGRAGVSCVNVAAAAALALLPYIPDTPMSISSVRDQAELESVLNSAGNATERAGLETLFGMNPHTTRGARLDPLTTGHLGAEYQVVTIDGISYLAGQRGAQ